MFPPELSALFQYPANFLTMVPDLTLLRQRLDDLERDVIQLRSFSNGLVTVDVSADVRDALLSRVQDYVSQLQQSGKIDGDCCLLIRFFCTCSC